MIYVASPYTAPSRIVEEQRAIDVARYTSKLIADGFPAFSPIAHGHFIDKCTDKGKAPDYRRWVLHGLALLSTSSEMHVLMLAGWRASKGVQTEIDYAEQSQIDVGYYEPSEYRRVDALMSVV